MFSKSQYLGGPPTSLCIRERRQRRDSVSRSDTSGSSAGDLGDITPCNASPHMPGIISFRAPIRDEAEELWRRNLQGFLINQPTSYAADLILQLHRVVKVRQAISSRFCFMLHTHDFFFVFLGTDLEINNNN